MKVTIDDDLEKAFCKMAFRLKGRRKGVCSEAAEEAMRVWLAYIKLKNKDIVIQ
jgi:hypothetical protein